MIDPLNPGQVAQEIARLTETLESTTEQYAIDIREGAEKQARFKGAYATAMVTVIADGTKRTVAEREALAEMHVNDQRVIADIADAKAKATREALTALRTQIDALRSLGANLRVQT